MSMSIFPSPGHGQDIVDNKTIIVIIGVAAAVLTTYHVSSTAQEIYIYCL